MKTKTRKVFIKTRTLFSSSSGKDQKKKVFINNDSSGDLRLDAHQSQIIGGDADEDHTQIIGGDTVKLLGEYIPPSPQVSEPLPSKLPTYCYTEISS